MRLRSTPRANREHLRKRGMLQVGAIPPHMVPASSTSNTVESIAHRSSIRKPRPSKTRQRQDTTSAARCVDALRVETQSVPAQSDPRDVPPMCATPNKTAEPGPRHT
eukprot:888396-Rhodomonas_salina.2